MPLEELLRLLRQRPFVPFRIHLLDGTSYEVRHPEMVLPGARSFILGENSNPELPYYEPGRWHTISLLAVGRLEVIESQPASGSNGQQQS